MSRAIPLDQALTDEDREYLETRGRTDIIERLDRQFGDTEPPEPEQNPAQSLRTGDQTIVDAPGMANPAPASLGARQRAAALGETSELKQETDDQPYEDWTKDDLQTQAKARELSQSGNKQELADRLRDWDEQQEDPEPEDDDE